MRGELAVIFLIEEELIGINLYMEKLTEEETNPYRSSYFERKRAVNPRPPTPTAFLPPVFFSRSDDVYTILHHC
jgi:hypothetical protein